MPVIRGVKSETERFAGALDTYTIEAMMQDGKALQSGTSHFLGQNFGKAFNVQFINKENEPEFQDAKALRYKEEFDIPDYDISIITASKRMADLFEQTVAIGATPKKVSNWLMGETMRLLKEKEMEPEDITFTPESLAKLIELTDKGTINSTVAKDVFVKIFEENIDVETFVLDNGLGTVSDEGALRETIEKVVAENPQSVEDYRGGKKKAIGFLVGQTMKAMQGKADPGVVNKILQEILQ